MLDWGNGSNTLRMEKHLENIMKSIVGILIPTMLFSCGNTDKQVRDFLADKNMPMLTANNIYLIHTDSGKVDVKMKASLLKDFRNRSEHPYTEFPKGIKIVNVKKKDSTSIVGDYAISYGKTSVAEIKGNVIIFNYTKKNKLTTSQIFWDQKTHIFFTEKNFTLYTLSDTIPGRGFESDEQLQNWSVKNMHNGSLQVQEIHE